jgi:hypothetical protein
LETEDSIFHFKGPKADVSKLKFAVKVKERKKKRNVLCLLCCLLLKRKHKSGNCVVAERKTEKSESGVDETTRRRHSRVLVGAERKAVRREGEQRKAKTKIGF